MAARYLLSFLVAVLAVTGSAIPPEPCKYIPGDAGWPRQNDWGRLNATVGGRLIATVPVGHVCHESGPFAAYDEAACEDLGKAFMNEDPATLCPVPGEILNPYWQNETCSPFTAPELPCELGNRPVYSINVTGPEDVQAGLEFASRNNIRLVIRNTGIDYLGNSAGQGSLALWTYNLKAIEVIEEYESALHSGPAMKVGAGVIGGEVYAAAQKAGYRVVAPECGLVGFGGGYIQAGGQSQLVTAYGLAADQVLEWEVVTPEGEYLIVTPEQNADLYWALAGGGGGTYAVVLSVTVKAFPEGPVAGGQMVVQSKNSTALWEAIGIWYNQAPSYMNRSRNNIQFFVTRETLTILSFTMPDQNASAIYDLLDPFVSELDRLTLPYNLTTTNYDSYIDSFIASYGALPYGNLCPTNPIISSRLISRSTVLNATTNQQLMDVFRDITDDSTWWIGCSFLNVDSSPGSARPAHPPNAVLPAWREAIAYCNPQTHEAYDWENPQNVAELRQKLVNDIFPALEEVTPGAGVLNEIDPTYKGRWKENFYGANYDRLLEIKHAYDPENIMYGQFAVGSDEFTIDSEGRLCRA